MVDFKQITDARKILGLGETATLDSIKDAYRRLALQYHPDKCKKKDKKKCEEMFKKITFAKEILQHYCDNYKYSFKQKDVNMNTIGGEYYDYLKRFYSDWWGDFKK